jgi:hypothetical protein
VVEQSTHYPKFKVSKLAADDAETEKISKESCTSLGSFGSRVSISPTFYEQLLCQNPFAKKLQTKIQST